MGASPTLSHSFGGSIGTTGSYSSDTLEAPIIGNVAAGSVVTLTIAGVNMPRAAGPLAPINIRERGRDDQERANIIGYNLATTITAVALTSVSLTPSSAVVSATTDITVGFELHCSLLTTDVVTIVLNSDFDIPTTVTIDTTSGISVSSGSENTALYAVEFNPTAGVSSGVKSFKLKNIKNPRMVKAWTYDILIADAAGRMISQITGQTGYTLTAESTSGHGVTPAVTTTGGTGNWAFSLGITSALVSGDKVILEYPNYYPDLGASPGLTTSDNIATPSGSGKTVTLTVDSAGLNSGFAFTLTSGVTNPRYVPGTLGTIAVTYKDSNNYVIGTGTISAPSLSGGTLTSGTAVPATTTTFGKGTVAVSLQSHVELVNGDKIIVTMPTTNGAAVTTGSFTAVADTGHTATSGTASGSAFTIEITSSSISAGTTITFTIQSGKYQVRTNEGSSGAPVIDVSTASDEAIGTKTAAATSITAGTLAGSITAVTLEAKQVTTYTVTISTYENSGAVSNGDHFHVTFPSGYSIVASPTCTPSSPGSLTIASAATTGLDVKVTTGVGGAAGSTFTFTIAGVTNPTTAGTTGQFGVEIRDSGDTLKRATEASFDTVTITADVTPPGWSATYPKVQSPTTDGATMAFDVDEASSTGYYVVVARDATAPTSGQVENGQDSTNSAALASGSKTLTSASTEYTAAASGLADATNYDAYFVAKDAAGNLQASPIKVQFTTATDSTPPTWAAGFPKTTSTTVSGFVCSFKFTDSSGYGWCVVVASGASAPSTAQIKAGNDATGNPALQSGSITISNAGTTYGTTMNSLNPSTTYDVYFVAQDSATTPNLASGPTKVSVTTLADTTPPGWVSSWPKISNVGTFGFDVEFKIDSVGTGYYVVVPNGDGAPSSAQVKNGQKSSGAAAIKSGTLTLSSANTLYTATVSALTAATSYDVYFVAQDAAASPNLMASPSLVSQTTNTDTTKPSWIASYPQIGSTGLTSATLLVRNDEPCTVYYVVVSSGAAAPSSAQVEAGNDQSSSPALKAGSISVAVLNTEYSGSVTGLSQATSYDVYLAAKDPSSNLMTSPASLSFSTSTSLFTGVSGSLSVATAYAVPTVTTSFTVTLALVATDEIHLEFPAGFTLTSSSYTISASGATLPTTATRSGQKLTIVVGTTITTGTAITITVSPGGAIRTPSLVGASGSITIRSSDSGDSSTKDSGSFSGPVITAGAVTRCIDIYIP
eukprot:TRINITY_DN37_c0_g2_i2.p1 TRINITY_DN37_c0_g2~~TRINITY_DN37_c0_g2_i2.p1  ORF type:complete len:1371 (+),score=290.14 TRINITY_DN37_c0_g2_i2:438-4115(+)